MGPIRGSWVIWGLPLKEFRPWAFPLSLLFSDHEVDRFYYLGPSGFFCDHVPKLLNS